jgi:hypothetical protein
MESADGLLMTYAWRLRGAYGAVDEFRGAKRFRVRRYSSVVSKGAGAITLFSM